MRIRRCHAVTAVSALLVALVAGPVAAQPADTDDDVESPYDNGEDPEVEGSQISLDSLGPECVEDVPYLSWSFSAEGDIDVDRMTITFINPDGDDLSYDDQPLVGRLMWPGADADAQGSGTNWPGWVFRDGRWIEEDDGFAFTRNNVQVGFSFNPTLVQSVQYPPPTWECADPPQPVRTALEDEPTVAVAGVTLARTGADALLLALFGLLAVGTGGFLVLRARRRSEA